MTQSCITFKFRWNKGAQLFYLENVRHACIFKINTDTIEKYIKIIKLESKKREVKKIETKRFHWKDIDTFT